MGSRNLSRLSALRVLCVSPWKDKPDYSSEIRSFRIEFDLVPVGIFDVERLSALQLPPLRLKTLRNQMPPRFFTVFCCKAKREMLSAADSLPREKRQRLPANTKPCFLRVA